MVRLRTVKVGVFCGKISCYDYIKFFMLLVRVVLMRDAGGMHIVEMFVDNCEFLKIIVMVSLSALIEDYVSTILNPILLRTRIATTPPACLICLSLRIKYNSEYRTNTYF